MDNIKESPWDLVIRLEKPLRRMLHRTVGPRKVDDAWSEVILERIVRVCELHDASRGPIEGYVIGTMRWYAYKWAWGLRVKRLRSTTERLSPSEPAPAECDLVADLDLSLVLSSLDEYERWLVQTHYIEGYTIVEMARSSNKSRLRIKRDLEAAMYKARSNAMTATIVSGLGLQDLVKGSVQ